MSFRGEFYSKRAARRLLGQTFELVYPYFGVPDGTRGRITDISPIPVVLGRGYELVIEWEVEDRVRQQAPRDHPIPHRSWFSRGEMDRYMQHVEPGEAVDGTRGASKEGRLIGARKTPTS